MATQFFQNSYSYLFNNNATIASEFSMIVSNLGPELTTFHIFELGSSKFISQNFFGIFTQRCEILNFSISPLRDFLSFFEFFRNLVKEIFLFISIPWSFYGFSFSQIPVICPKSSKWNKEIFEIFQKFDFVTEYFENQLSYRLGIIFSYCVVLSACTQFFS